MAEDMAPAHVPLARTLTLQTRNPNTMHFKIPKGTPLFDSVMASS